MALEEKTVSSPSSWSGSRYDRRLASRIKALTMQMMSASSPRSLWILLNRASDTLLQEKDDESDWQACLAQLMDTISGIQSIQELLIWGHRMNDDVSHILSLHLISNSLTELHIRHGHVSSLGVAEIIQTVERNPSVQTLTLYNMEIDVEGARLIGDMLAHNESVTNLNLAWNPFGAEGAAHIAVGLQTNSKLTCLKLGDYGKSNEINDDAVHHFAEALLFNRTLKKLDLMNNHITYAGIVLLKNAVSTNETIQEIVCRISSVSDQERRNLRRELGMKSRIVL
jgi:hypothetical protein